MDFIDNISLMRKNWKPSKAWDFEMQKNEKKDKILMKKYPPNIIAREEAKQYGKTIVNIIDTMDQSSINKSADAKIALSTLFSLPSLIIPIIGGIGGYICSKKNLVLKDSPKISAFNGAAIGSAIFSIAYHFISAQFEKTTTRIARYQTRKNELNNISSFLESDKNTSNSKTTKKVNLIETYKNAFKTLNEMKKDYKDYKTWKKQFAETEKELLKDIKNTKLSPEEAEKAQKDRNRINNIIKKIELASNNEEINFEYAIMLVNYFAKMAGAAIITAVFFLLPESSGKKSSKITGLGKTIIPLAVPILSMFIATILTKYKKDSAKLGRFEKKQELMENEENFITYGDNKRNEVNLDDFEIKKQSWFSNVAKDIKNIKTMPSRLSKMYKYYESSNDKNTKNQISKEDLELMQKQLFYAFEKIDEKSEGFSDDIDAVLDATNLSILAVINTFVNIYILNKLSNKLKNINNNKMPGFLDSIKMMKHLSKKDLIAIFIVPHIVKATLVIVLSTISAQIRKQANKVGVMTAIDELKDEKLFVKENLSKIQID